MALDVGEPQLVGRVGVETAMDPVLPDRGGGLLVAPAAPVDALSAANLPLQNPVGPTQPDQLGMLIGGHVRLVAGVDVGMIHSPPQTRLADLHIHRDLGDRLLPQPGQLNGAFDGILGTSVQA